MWKCGRPRIYICANGEYRPSCIFCGKRGSGYFAYINSSEILANKSALGNDPTYLAPNIKTHPWRSWMEIEAVTCETPMKPGAGEFPAGNTGQWSKASVAILASEATCNLQLTERISRFRVRIPPSPLFRIDNLQLISSNGCKLPHSISTICHYSCQPGPHAGEP